MVEKEKVKPLAPSIYQNQTISDDEDTVYKKTTRRRKYVKWLSCIVASIIHLAVVVVILIFMVFKIKEPEIKMNDVMVNNFDFMNGSILQPGTTISLTTDISVKNPNFASFRLEQTHFDCYIFNNLQLFDL